MGANAEPFDLGRFISAQNGTFDTALAELRAGEKQSHWMWFVFPQMRGLGMSAMSQKYGIVSLYEAGAYLADPLLGERLKQCTEAVLRVKGRTLAEIFGSPDDMKFRSSMTLFAEATGGNGGIYRQALDRCCGGAMDARTLELLGRPQS
jgi:uncharacterized protein (DUF1810 family)